MHRIDHATALANANGAGKDGFTNGVPGTTPRTIADDAILNALQEEIALAVEDNAALVKGTNTQLRDAVRAHHPASKYTLGSAGTQVSAATFTQVFNTSGYALSDTDTRIQVPSSGLYLVAFHMECNDFGSFATGVMYRVTLAVSVAGSGAFTACTRHMGTSNIESLGFSAAGLVSLTTASKLHFTTNETMEIVGNTGITIVRAVKT